MSKKLATQKLDKELKELKKGSAKVDIMKKAVHDALAEFCRQDAEFAQAVLQGGSFSDCMAAVARGVGSAISDADAYRKAVRFYFPGADIRFQMTVNLCAGAQTSQVSQASQASQASERRPRPKVLDLFDLM